MADVESEASRCRIWFPLNLLVVGTHMFDDRVFECV